MIDRRSSETGDARGSGNRKGRRSLGLQPESLLSRQTFRRNPEGPNSQRQHIEYWQLSPLKHKKYRVWIRDGKRLFHVDFGDKRYQHFRDRSPLKAITHLDHNDPKRRERYYQRHKVDYPPYSADYMSKKFLWS